jgi:hypothetical protein
MRASRPVLDENLISIKGAIDASLRLGGGVTSFAKVIGYAVSTVSKWASLNRVMDGDREVLEYGEYVIPVDIAILADRRAQSPIIVSEAARQLGYRLEPLADELADGDQLSEDDILAIMDEATDVWKAARAAFADKRIDALEKKELSQKLRRVMRAAGCALQRLERM